VFWQKSSVPGKAKHCPHIALQKLVEGVVGKTFQNGLEKLLGKNDVFHPGKPSKPTEASLA
jgi:hypothetical protein